MACQRPGQWREAVLDAWGIGEDGRKVLLGLMPGSKEDVETPLDAPALPGASDAQPRGQGPDRSVAGELTRELWRVPDRRL